MNELSRTEKSLVGDAPHAMIDTIHGSLWPDLHAKVRAVCARPSRIKKIPAAQLDTFVAELERIAGVTIVLAALDADKRVCAGRLRASYTDPIALVDAEGNDVPIPELVERVLSIGSSYIRSTTRDVARRLHPERRAALLDYVVQHQPSGNYWTYTTSVGVLAELAGEGEIDLTRCHPSTRASVISRQLGSLGKFSATIVADAVCDAQDKRSAEAVISALWSEANDTLLDEIVCRWRKGECGEVRESITNLLAAQGRLENDELSAAARGMQGLASQVLAQLEPTRREVVLRALPHTQRLGDVASILEGLGSMSNWAICDVVRRGRPGDVVQWLRKPSTGAILTGTLGVDVMSTILEHWTREEQDRLVDSLCNHTFATTRSEVHHLALHGPGAGAIIAGTGTIGGIARKHLYEELGAESQHWDYLRGMLPTWRGSTAQLARAVRKMAKAR